MIIEFADPGYNWLYVTLAGIGFILLLAAALTVTIIYARRGYPRYSALEGWVPSLWGVLVLYVIFAGVLGGAMSADLDYRDRVADAKVVALTNAGFSNVELDGEEFTASDDGEYFKGQLIRVDSPDGVYAYQVVELVAVGE